MRLMVLAMATVVVPAVSLEDARRPSPIQIVNVAEVARGFIESSKIFTRPGCLYRNRQS